MKYAPIKFKITYRATFHSSDLKKETRLWLAQPTTSIYQKIDDFFVSQEPQRVYWDKQGNKILYFEFKNQTRVDIVATVRTKLWKYKINLQGNKISLPKMTEKLRRYIISERYLEQVPELKKITHQVTKNKPRVLDKLQAIFNFVVNRFTYQYPVPQRGVKYILANNFRGDCGEYSSLFVAMCRIVKIPAMNRTGYIILPKQRKVLEHGWASVYLSPIGWVDVDTQYAALEKNSTIAFNNFFCQRSNYRLVVTNGFNISLKPKISSRFNTDYWRMHSLPLISSTVQTLQPIFFTITKRVQFENHISVE